MFKSASVKSRSLVAAAALIVLTGQPALASSQTLADAPMESVTSLPSHGLSEADLAFLIGQLHALGVDERHHYSLIAKVQRGELPDSDKSGVEPLTERSVVRADGSSVIERTFPDGSKSETSVTPVGPELLRGPQLGTTLFGTSLTECRKTSYSHASSSYWDNCLVRHSALTWHMSFRSSFTFGANGQRINKYSEARTGGIGMSTGKFNVVRASANRTGTATIELRARQTQGIAGIGASRDVGLRLDVSRSGPKVSNWGM